MKKALFSIFALLILFSSCDKDETTSVTPDPVTWTVTNTTEAGTGAFVSVLTFNSTRNLDANNLYLLSPSEFTSVNYVFSGNKAVVTTKKGNNNEYSIVYIMNDNSKSVMTVPGNYSTK